MLWHFGKNRSSLERVQKSALKVILGKRYTSYSDALKKLKIESLEDRRRAFCLNFQVEKLRKLFKKDI